MRERGVVSRREFLLRTTGLAVVAVAAPGLLTKSVEPKSSGGVLLVPESQSPQAGPQEQLVFHNGVSFTSRKRGELATPQARESLLHLRDMGVESIALTPTALQQSTESTAILRDTPLTSSYDEIRDTIMYAHKLGLSVMLKPHIDIEGFEKWRGDIGRRFTQKDWAEWFNSYRAFILPYAQIAHDTGVELFCVGTELKGTSSNETQWRSIIKDIKRSYKGATTYAAQHSGEERYIRFWDALDYIGIDAYYPLSDTAEPTVGKILLGWARRMNQIKALANRYNRGVLLTEYGFRNVQGTTMNPEEYLAQATRSDIEQATAIEATLYFLKRKEVRKIIKGSFLYELKAILDNPLYDRSHSPQGKIAEDVIEDIYSKILLDV